jgi:predicted dehydrogenase
MNLTIRRPFASHRAYQAHQVIVANAGFNAGDPNQWRLKKAMAGGGSMMDIGIYALMLRGIFPVRNPLKSTP